MPYQPSVKKSGDTVRSADWNATTAEVGRLETAKVNRTGDSITGTLNVAILSVTSGLSVPDSSISGQKILDSSISGQKLRDNFISGEKITDSSISGGKLINDSIAGDKLLPVPSGKLKDRPGLARALGNVSWDQVLGLWVTATWNVNSVVRNDAGRYTIFHPPFPDPSYPSFAMPIPVCICTGGIISLTSVQVSNFSVKTTNFAGQYFDGSFGFALFYPL